MNKKIGLLVLIVILSVIVSSAAMLSLSSIPTANAQTLNLHLYGSATLGWGFSPTTITSPGPLIQVYKGEIVNLTLTSQDGVIHQFWVDYNGNFAVDPGEPVSPTFTSTIVYSFTANVTGSFNYHCVFHPTIMVGNFKTLNTGRTWNLHFYGSASLGWGFASSNITSPGPTVTVYQGDIVNLTLTSQDGLPHQFFIDYNNNSIVDPGEPASASFTGTITYTFIADTLGFYKYRCAFHPTVMVGTFKITVPGDVNGSGAVDVSDAALLGFYWHKTSPPAPALVDINGNGIVDISDAAILGSHWRQHI